MKRIIFLLVIFAIFLPMAFMSVSAADGSIELTASETNVTSGEIFEVTFTVKNAEAGSIELPVHFNPKVIQVADAEGKIVPGGLKTAGEIRNGAAGVITGQALNGELDEHYDPLYWNGAVFSNPNYPYLDNEKGLYKLRFENTENRTIRSETLITIRFVAVSAGSADIRAVREGDAGYSELFRGGFMYRVFPENAQDAPEEIPFSFNGVNVTVTGGTVTPPAGSGGGGGGAPAVTVTEPSGTDADVFVYDVPEKVFESAFARAESETDNVLKIKVDAKGSYTGYIVNIPAGSVVKAYAAYVFTTEIETPLGTVAFDNGEAARSITPASKLVICTVTRNAKTVTVDGVPIGEAAVAVPKGFADVPPGHWAYECVNALADAGIVNGVDGTRFDPDANVTREQFAKMLTAALNLYDERADSSFPDVPKTAWYYGYVSSAVKAGIISGYQDGTFGTGRNITRQEAAVMVSRAGLDISAEASGDSFTDDELIAEWAKDAVYAMQSEKIISGFEDGSFKPQSNATRAQSAKIIYSIFLSAR
ncbi:MAG: S-layer homology domain-containing protein [Oscillospiraceae bacterium]|nr:S-layer homology domain-containing protein [Oscillospiraceae bacterium]